MPARCALQPALERAEMRGSEAARALHATITRGLRSIAMLLANSPLVWATCLALPAVPPAKQTRKRRPTSKFASRKPALHNCVLDCGSVDVPCSAATRRDAPQREYKSQTHCGAD